MSALTLSACARAEPPPRFAPPTASRTEAGPPDSGDGLGAAEPVLSVSAVNAVDAVDAVVAVVQIDEIDAGLAPTVAARAPAPKEPAPPEVPLVDAELCRSACENALAVTLAELPQTTIASMRDELTRALKDDCPTRCVAKASLESARCIASARTALALASCP